MVVPPCVAALSSGVIFWYLLPLQALKHTRVAWRARRGDAGVAARMESRFHAM
jgi:hypothetical protein